MELVEAHSMPLRCKGVHSPKASGANSYILQNQLAAGEPAPRISLANTDEKISDAALNALELGVADARTGRPSCPPPTREVFFAARRERLRNFLDERWWRCPPATTLQTPSPRPRGGGHRAPPGQTHDRRE